MTYLTYATFSVKSYENVVDKIVIFKDDQVAFCFLVMSEKEVVIVGCNHIVIAGSIGSLEYAKADYLAMNLEQHLDYEIRRDGTLPEFWLDYYKKVLVPLGISSPEMERGKLTVYTREGRLLGDLNDFIEICRQKYSILVDFPDTQIMEIREAHIKNALKKVCDAEESEFENKVQAFLGKRIQIISDLKDLLNVKYNEKNTIEKSIGEIDAFASELGKVSKVLYDLHKYPPPDEAPAAEQNEDEGDDTEEKEDEKNEQGDTKTEDKTETTQDDSEKEADASEKVGDESEEGGDKVTEDSEKQAAPVSEEETGEKPQEEGEKSVEEGEKSQEEGEKTPEGTENLSEEEKQEEEDFTEQDPDALEAQTKFKETFVVPEFPILKSLGEYTNELEIEPLLEFVAAEKFRWKKMEKKVLVQVEKVSQMKTKVIEELLDTKNQEIKEVEQKIVDATDFVFPDFDQEIVDAASIRFSASFTFI